MRGRCARTEAIAPTHGESTPRGRPHRTLFRLAVVLVVTSAGLSPSARGSELPDKASARLRYTALFETFVDGVASPRTTSETTFAGEMMRRGSTFIDEAQSRKIRQMTSASALLEGPVPEVITALDADVIVAARVRLEKDDSSALLRGRAFRYRGSVEARIIAVDTGEVLASFLVRESGVDTTVGGAEDSAQRRAGMALAEKVLGAESARTSKRVELTVEGVSDLGILDRLREALLAIPGVTQAAVTRASDRRSELEVMLGARIESAAELARILRDTPETGVVVTGYSSRSIEVRYTPARGERLPIVFSAFRARGAGTPPEASAMLTELIGRTLLDSQRFEPLADAEVTPTFEPSLTRREARLKALGLKERPGLVLSGWYQDHGATRELEAELRAATPRLDLIARQHQSCPRNQIASCGRTVAEALEKQLARVLEEGVSSVLLEGPAPLSIEAIELGDLFPARMLRDTSPATGKMIVRNRSASRAAKVLLRTFAEGLMSAPSERQLKDIAPESTLELPIAFVLDPAALRTLEQPRLAHIKLELSYELGGRRRSASRTVEAQALDPNAIDWKVEASVGAFVTPRAEAVKTLADTALAAIPKSLAREPVARALALQHALRGLTYQRDAVHPGRSEELDSVQLPAETLARGRGDCEDLAALYAALAEASGLRAMLVLTPGHVLAAIDTELLAQSWNELTLDPTRALLYAGRTWIPIETTQVDGTFERAWADGAKAIEEARRDGTTPTFVDLRSAWKIYPPLELDAPAKGSKTEAHSRFEGLAAELEHLARQRRAVVDATLSSLVADLESGKATPEALLAGARLYAGLGNAEEARRLLTRALERVPDSHEALNDMANVELLLGQPRAALAIYERALRLAANDPGASLEIHLNAAIAARTAEDHGAFTAHIADGLDLAAGDVKREQIVLDFLEGLAGSGQTRGERWDHLERRRFRESVSRALEARTSRPRAKPDQTRAAGDGGVRSGLAQILFWMVPDHAEPFRLTTPHRGGAPR